jgi:hypothetical protein
VKLPPSAISSASKAKTHAAIEQLSPSIFGLHKFMTSNGASALDLVAIVFETPRNNVFVFGVEFAATLRKLFGSKDIEEALKTAREFAAAGTMPVIYVGLDFFTIESWEFVPFTSKGGAA